MNCNDCTQTKTLNACASTIQLGTISNLNENVYVYIERTGLAERITRFAVTSDGNGVVAVELDNDDARAFTRHHCYTVYVTLRNTIPTDRLTLTVEDGDDGTPGDCFQINWEGPYTDADARATLTNQTLEIL